MAYAFDTLGYAKRLREAGVPQHEAEAHAEAAREFVMGELVTKSDLALSLDNLKLSLTVPFSNLCTRPRACAVFETAELWI
jgi:hypothetical protein